MEILNFSLEYLPEIKKIDKECFSDRESFSRGYLLFLWQRFPQGFLVAKEGKEIIGYGICQKEKEKGIIFSIAVKKKWQNFGVGTEILKNLIEILKKEKIEKVVLHVREDNERAISFYKNLGFKIKEKVKKYYSNGKAAYLMEKILKKEE
jgi:ribosomal-protein-alanine N-acetyltransferase